MVLVVLARSNCIEVLVDLHLTRACHVYTVIKLVLFPLLVSEQTSCVRIFIFCMGFIRILIEKSNSVPRFTTALGFNFVAYSVILRDAIVSLQRWRDVAVAACSLIDFDDLDFPLLLLDLNTIHVALCLDGNCLAHRLIAQLCSVWASFGSIRGDSIAQLNIYFAHDILITVRWSR